MPPLDSRTPRFEPGARLAPPQRPQAMTFFVAAFLISLAIPLLFNLGPIRLSVYRIVLIAGLFPALMLYLSGKAGMKLKADLALFVIWAWSALSMIHHHGFGNMIEPMGILFIELIGAYLLGRAFVRTPEAFYAIARLFFFVALALMPFTIYEMLTAHHILLELANSISYSYQLVFSEKRLGLNRAQGPFEHPIMLGCYFATAFGLSVYVMGYGKMVTAWLFRSILITAAAFGSLSSGALVAVFIQFLLTVYEKGSRRIKKRWTLLGMGAVFSYVFVDVLSNRTPLLVFLSYAAFNPHTAYNRLRIWEWGSMNMFDNPIFGIGFNDWVRGPGMTASADMYWLVPGMQHGVLVFVLYQFVFFRIIIKLALRKNLGPRVSSYRFGYIFSLFGLYVAAWSVHYWGVSLVLFFFMLGSGCWMLEYEDPNADKAPEPEKRRIRTAI